VSDSSRTLQYFSGWAKKGIYFSFSLFPSQGRGRMRITNIHNGLTPGGRSIVVAIIVILAGAGCAGRTPNPIAIIQDGDEKKTCEEFDLQITEIRKTVLDYYPKVKKTEGYNTSVLLIGVIIPWYLPASLLSDARKADLVELVAFKKRNNHLVNLERQNGCGFEHAIMPVENADTWIGKVEKWFSGSDE